MTTAGAPEVAPARDEAFMRLAVANAATVRLLAPPNPWVGAVLVAHDGEVFQGATAAPGGAHAEIGALRAAGARGRGATLYTTLEPCSHHGRTGPCADAIVEAGVARVVVGIADPDPLVAGRGIALLRDAGIDVVVGVGAAEISEQLRAYITHRTLGRPHVVLKLGASLDGRIAAPDGTSQWITGSEARADAHRLRAESDAIVVGAGTVRADDPSLTVRDFHAAGEVPDAGVDPVRVVLGRVAPEARVQPARSCSGPLADVLTELAASGVVQVLVEGGATVAGRFHASGLVDEYVVYLAPAIFGGDDARSMFTGAGAASIADVWRGEFHSVVRLGPDVRLILRPRRDRAGSVLPC
jgi:diaminohydroxyphosphoribosylaminopyrimidine deaminase/5-amino-6-(5-phosphoribosylamino)uracil reductase